MSKIQHAISLPFWLQLNVCPSIVYQSYDRTGVRPFEARRMDVFSMGLLIFWLLFENQISTSELAPSQPHPRPASDLDPYRGLKVLQELKFDNTLIEYAFELVSTDIRLDDDSKSRLTVFFGQSLDSDPDLREEEVTELFEILQWQETTSEIENMPIQQIDPSPDTFEVFPSLFEFYAGDYRVRHYIVECLKHELQLSPNEEIAFQLTCCYYIGFGLSPNIERSHQLLLASNRSQDDFDAEIEESRQSSNVNMTTTGDFFQTVTDAGQFRMNDLSDYYNTHGLLEDAEKTTIRDLHAIESVFGPSHPLTVRVKVSLISLLITSGQQSQAEDLCKQAVKDMEKIFGKDHNQTLATISHLAAIYDSQSRWAEAEQLLRRLIETRLRVLGPESLSTLASQTHLATSYLHSKRWTDAEKLCKQMFEVQKRTYGIDHIYTQGTMANLAAAYNEQGKLDQACALEESIMQAMERTRGKRNPHTLFRMSALAMTYARQGRLDEAEPMAVRAVEALKEAAGLDASDTLISMHNLAFLYNLQGRYEKAEDIATYLVETNTRTLGPENRMTLDDMNELASAYKGQGRWEEVARLHADLAEKRGRLLGAEHMQTLIHKGNLAFARSQLGRWVEAEQLWLQVLDAQNRALGRGHPETLNTMCNLASYYKEAQRWEDVEKYSRDIIDRRQHDSISTDDKDTLSRMIDLARALFHLNRLSEAEEAQERVLGRCQDLIGASHPETIHAMGRLAMIRFCRVDLDAAIVTMEDVLELESERWGSEHPNVVGTRATLRYWRTWSSESWNMQQHKSLLCLQQLLQNPGSW